MNRGFTQQSKWKNEYVEELFAWFNFPSRLSLAVHLAVNYVTVESDGFRAKSLAATNVHKARYSRSFAGVIRSILGRSA
jgi:hypothetical protein